LHIKPSHLQWTDRWFEKHGAQTVFWARMIPIVRTFISLPAGVARMPFWKFTIYTFLGCIPWMILLTTIGYYAGENWTKWQSKLHYIDYTVAAIILAAAAYFAIKWWRGRGSDDAPDADAALTGTDAADDVA
jgi:membrane protein DedA with SNARE-associated domain